MQPSPLTINDIIVDPPPEGVLVDPASWFETPGNVELEIGCGKGGFLLRQAQEELAAEGTQHARRDISWAWNGPTSTSASQPTAWLAGAFTTFESCAPMRLIW